jgi:hypothetical protein
MLALLHELGCSWGDGEQLGGRAGVLIGGSGRGCSRAAQKRGRLAVKDVCAAVRETFARLAAACAGKPWAVELLRWAVRHGCCADAAAQAAAAGLLQRPGLTALLGLPRERPQVEAAPA